MCISIPLASMGQTLLRYFGVSRCMLSKQKCLYVVLCRRGSMLCFQLSASVLSLQVQVQPVNTFPEIIIIFVHYIQKCALYTGLYLVEGSFGYRCGLESHQWLSKASARWLLSTSRCWHWSIQWLANSS